MFVRAKRSVAAGGAVYEYLQIVRSFRQDLRSVLRDLPPRLSPLWRARAHLAAIRRPSRQEPRRNGGLVSADGLGQVIQTLKVELIWTRDWESIEELRNAIQAWLQAYNSERPHQALAWAAPLERRAQNLSGRTVAA